MDAVRTGWTYDAEVRHFDALVEKIGESWWGHTTTAGVRRLQRRARLIAKALPWGPEFDAMEIAAGAGALTTAILREVPAARITATDISPISLAHLHKRVGDFRGVRIVRSDITSLEFEDESFDAVIGNSALHHVDIPRCLSELHRVLKPGGRLMVFEPNLLNPEVLLETTVARRFARCRLNYSAEERTHTRGTYAGRLRQAEFAEVRVTPFDFLHPLTPKFLVGAGAVLCRILEHVPLIRELSGSLILAALKPKN